ncbi:MAG: hypothetical protein COB17_03375 [Sulfurimonas sp.]|nr:MAG: hypothetical protein COB17_03375 [Sulfurimonas sp.]
MKIIFLSILLLTTLFAQSVKVCFYTIENNIKNFKSLKFKFDKYLSKYGDYEFQAFSDKSTFEKYINNNNVILILSSTHYKNIIKTKKFKAKFIALKNNKIKDIEVIIGKKNRELDGVITSAHSEKYTKNLLKGIDKKLSILVVPKEIDALMSVGFGMSDFAVVSKGSFINIQEINGFLTKDLRIYNELNSTYRIVIALAIQDFKNKNISNIFEDMQNSENGQYILYTLGIDRFIQLKVEDLRYLGGIK